MKEYPIKVEDEEFYEKALVIAMKLQAKTTRTARFIWTGFNAVLVTLALFAVAAGFVMVFDRSVPTSFDTVAIVSPSVQPGDPVKVHFVLTRDRACEMSASYDIIDGAKEIRHFDPVHQDAMGIVGVPDDVIKPFAVPLNAAPGHAKLRLKWSWECPVNLVHPIYPIALVWPDMPFEILPR